MVSDPDTSDPMIRTSATCPVTSPGGFGAKLKALGVTIANSEPDESTRKNRKMLTSTSPFAANALGKLAAETLLFEVALNRV